MKGLIITLTGNYNYGNRLQNYALQEIIKSQGFEVETYNNIYASIETEKMKKKIAQKNLKRVINGFKNRIKTTRQYSEDIERTKNIKKFTDKYIKVCDKSKEELKKYYDFFILGSDQVWNPNFTYDFDLNLGLIGTGKKVISYAASFGVNTIKEPLVELYKKALIQMKAISVRENEGKKLVKQISNKESQTVLDPTMLLTDSDWRKIENKPKNFIEKKYILVYCVSDSIRIVKKYVSQIVKKSNLEAIYMTEKKCKEYTSGVEEFLYYIDNAEMIFTDSFHACVFSILFSKDFWVVDRKKSQIGMNSRIYTLLNTFNLQNRRINGKRDRNRKFFKKCNYEYRDEILNIKRKESLDFLNKAINKE